MPKNTLQIVQSNDAFDIEDCANCKLAAAKCHEWTADKPLPLYADRKTCAAIVTHFLFPVMPRTIAIESLLDGQAEALTQTAIKKALEGDSIALRLCMDRIAPLPKDAAVIFSMPKMHNTIDAAEAAGSVLRAVSEGGLTPIEATRVMGLIDNYRRTLELTEIEERLQALETANA